MNILYIDFETYYDTKSHYDLRSISTTEYLNDPRFKALGAGVQFNNDEPFWVTEANLRTFFRSHDWSDYIIVSHSKFDPAILAWKYNVNPKEWRDTKSMAMAVYGASVPSFSLKALSERLGFAPKGVLKTDGMTHPFTECDGACNPDNECCVTSFNEKELAEYCLRDVEICAKLYQELASKIPESQWAIMDWTIRAFTEPKLVINKEVAKQVQEEIKRRKEQVITELGIDPKILSSNQQFAKYLVTQGYRVPMKKNPKGELIPALALGDPQFLEMLKSPDVKLQTLCQARKEVKKTMEIKRAEKIQTIGEAYPFDIIFSGATQTHRFSGGAGAGGNPQNFPRESNLRRCIEAPEGSTLYVGDFKNIELRILAFISREPKLIKAIREGVNVYIEFAEKIYKRKVLKDTPEYHFGKAAILGLGYGMGAARFAQTVKQQGFQVSEELAKETVYTYRDYYPYVPNFWNLCELVIQMMANGQPGYFPSFSAIKVKKDALVLPSGLEMKYPNLRRENEEWVYDKFKSQVTQTDKIKLYGGKLTENICQALAGEICKDAIGRLIKATCPPSGQVHDELLLLSTQSNTKEQIKKAMTDRLAWWPELILDVDLGWGKNWQEAKKPRKEIVCR